jgi:hypothetical protein
MRGITQSVQGCLIGALAAFAIAPTCASAAQEQVIYRFSGGSDGAQPVAGLVADANGNLYGVASTGGATNTNCPSGCGTVFELSPQQGGGWSESTLYEFQGGDNDGLQPDASLVMDSSGNLYGVTYAGGPTAGGVAFELTLSGGSWTETVLHTFPSKLKNARQTHQPPSVQYKDIAKPGGVALGPDGNLYGFGPFGGTCVMHGKAVACWGAAFELARPAKPNGKWTETMFWSPPKDPPVADPVGQALFDTEGNVYGIAQSFGDGNAFVLQPSGQGTWKETTLYAFQGGNDGGFPLGGLTLDGQGRLYGVTEGYQSLAANVFELSPKKKGPWTETTLFTFSNSQNGLQPSGSPILDSAGNLYGLTSGGGQDSLGVVYELSPSGKGWNQTVVYNFAGGSDGANPAGVLLMQSGTLYGVTLNGGSGSCANGSGCGTVFAITP